MIAKIIKGTYFSGVIAYILGKGEEKARVLRAEGVREHTIPSEIANDFALQASLRPRVQKPVYHTILSFSAEDTERLSDRIRQIWQKNISTEWATQILNTSSYGILTGSTHTYISVSIE